MFAIVQNFLAKRRLSALVEKVFKRRLRDETVEGCLKRACFEDMFVLAQDPTVRRMFFCGHNTISYADIANVVTAQYWSKALPGSF